MAGQYSKDIFPHEVRQKLERGESFPIIDVREQEEWDSGHIPGAKHIPLGTLNERHKELDLKQETIIVCRSGNRSGLACEHLESLGYNVVNMKGGMMNWDGKVEFGE